MKGDTGPEHLAALAGLLRHDPEASRRADAWMRADGTPCPPSEAELIGSAPDTEWALAAALHPGSAGEAETMAALLDLAAGTDAAVLLRPALRAEFVSMDGDPVVPAADRPQRFAAACRELALPGLDADAREQADALLGSLRASATGR